MKQGYRILIHNTVADKQWAHEFCDKFIERANTIGYGTGGWSAHSYYKRGILGLRISNNAIGIIKDGEIWAGYSQYVFRRLVNSRRIFGIVPVSELETKDGNPINLKGCVCTHHVGGTRVKFKNGFKEKDYTIYYETGDIKG